MPPPSTSRTATLVAAVAILAGALVVLITGSSVAYLAPVLVVGTALGAAVALLLPGRGARADTRHQGH